MPALGRILDDPFGDTADAGAQLGQILDDPFGAMEEPDRTVAGHTREFFTGIPAGAVEAVGTGMRGASAAPQVDPEIGLERARTGLDASLSILSEIEKGVTDDYTHSDLISRIGSEKSLLPNERIILDEALRDTARGDTEAVARARAELQQAYEERVDRPVLPVQERPLWKAGEKVSEFAERHFGAEPGYEDALSRQVGEGLGSLATGVAVSAAGGPVTGAALFTFMGAGEAADRAVQAGASDEDIVRAAGLGMGPGATDVLPVEILLNRLPVPGIKVISESVKRFGGERIARAIGRIGVQGLVEAIQEGGQQALQNLIAREVHSPDTVIMEGVEHGAGIGGIVGGIAGLTREGVLGIAGRRSRSSTGARAKAVNEVPPPTPEDEASPIRTEDIVEGRQRIADADATEGVNRFLRANELPEVGTPVRLNRLGAAPFEGVVTDATEGDQATGIGPGLTITGADGVTMMDASLEELARMGIQVQVLPMPASEAELEARRVDVEKEARNVAEEYRREARKLSAEEAATVTPRAIEPETEAVPVDEPATVPGNLPVLTQAQGVEVGRLMREGVDGKEAVARVLQPEDISARPEIVEVDERLRRLDEFTVAPTTVEPEATATPVGATTEAVDATRATVDATELEVDTTAREVVDEAESVVDTAPTDAQKKAGNYRHGHVRLHGMEISIENPKGSERSGVGKDGKPWSVTMPATYGYIRRSEGADGDQVDVYVGPQPESDQVFVVDQVDADTKAFDEHKIMLGYGSEEEALADYDAAFDDGRGPDRSGAVTPMSVGEFRNWLEHGDTKRPLNRAAGIETEATEERAGAGEAAAPGAPAPQPMLRVNGEPFKTRSAAMLSARNRKIDAEPVEVEGGWGLMPREEADQTGLVRREGLPDGWSLHRRSDGKYFANSADRRTTPYDTAEEAVASARDTVETRDRLSQARAQAEAEGLTGNDALRRAADIMERGQPETAAPEIPAEAMVPEGEPEPVAQVEIDQTGEGAISEAPAPQPIVRANGEPYKTEKSAALAARARGIEATPVRFEDGWALQEDAAAQMAEEVDARTDMPGDQTPGEVKDLFAQAPKAEPTPQPSADGSVDLFDEAPPAPPKAATDAIQDFGEKIEGARKDMASLARKALDKAKDVDVAAAPLSESFPQLNYAKMAEAGTVAPERLTFYAIVRGALPNKPRRSFKLRRWVDQVKAFRELANMVMDETVTMDEVREQGGQKFSDTAEMIAGLEPDLWSKAASTYQLDRGEFNWIGGRELPAGERERYFLRRHGRIYTESMSQDRAEAMRNAQDIIRSELQARQAKPKSKYTKINAYRDLSTKEIYIGFKLRGVREVQRLKTGFADANAAFEYISENRDELQAKIDEMRKPPRMRREENRERRGADRREGDVSPEQFSDMFGFRGVQFGNYVEGPRRQQDLNRAYDALMDMADAVGIPPKALALNGTLGLAFGARGRGGRAAAHYEPDQVVINLTKTAGPGSLAHEWLHALDNNFGTRGGSTYATEAGRNLSPEIRREVAAAWAEVVDAMGKSEFSVRAAGFDARRPAGKEYWSKTIEKAARAFERYIRDQLETQGFENDYLVNIDLDSGAYPTAEEMQRDGIEAAFGKLFETLETRETESGIELFQRAPLPAGFPDIPVSTTIAHLKRQPGYEAAKRGGDSRAAARIVRDVFKPEKVARSLGLADPSDVLVAPVALQEEAGGPINRLPHALAEAVARELGASTRHDIAQSNVTRHTGATLTNRMIERPEFDGTVERGRRYVLVDDVATSGSTLMEMAGFIEGQGGIVAGAVTLAASRGSTILKARAQSLTKLRERYGSRETEFRDAFGHGFEALTDREALDLAGVRPATFSGIVAARIARGGRGDETALRRDGRRGRTGDQARRGVGAGEAPPRTRIRLARRFDEARARIREDLQRVARKTFGARFNVELAESITAPDGGRATGAFDPVNRIAYIALRAQEDGMRNTLWHEGLHHLRSAGAFSNADGSPNAAWRTLERQAENWRREYGIDARYARDVSDMDESARERLLNEEAIAEALGDYAIRGRETGFGPTVRAAFNRILRFFRALANALRARGFQTWEDVFEGDIAGGRAGRRADAALASDPEFRQWFAGSKVVDRRGRPLVVYHGTRKDFERFEPPLAAFFTEDPYIASSYAEGDDGGNIRPSFLSLKNPMVHDAHGLPWWTVDSAKGLFSRKHRREIDDLVEEARAKGHDGLIVRFTLDEGYAIGGLRGTIRYNKDFYTRRHDVYVAFHPDQIRSAVAHRSELDRYLQTAWHGGPHEFDRFSTEHIGSGEGMQIYGYGLYFADKEGVADWYRVNTAGPMNILVDGVSIGPINSRNTIDKLARRLKIARRKAAEFVHHLEWLVSKGKTIDDAFEWQRTLAPRNREAAEFVEKAGDRISTRQSGAKYRVKLAPTVDEYLLWDEPFDKQSAKVKAAFAEMEAANQEFAQFSKDIHAYERHDADRSRGQEAYRVVAGALGSDRAASLELLHHGIRGIKYLDGASRTRPLRDIKREFLEMLPEDADLDIVGEMIGTGEFSPKHDALLEALRGDDWLGFDYPAQAISAALGPNVNNWDPSQTLLDAIAELRVDGTYNYVIFDDSDVAIEEIMLQRERLGLFDTEETDQGEQAVLPGAERISDRELAERRMAAPMRAKAPQRSMDEGLFGSPEGEQIDLEDAIEASQGTLFQREPSAENEPEFDRQASNWAGVDLKGAAEGVTRDKKRMGTLADRIKAQVRGTTAIQSPNVEVAETKTAKDLSPLMHFLAPPSAWSRKFPKIHQLIRSGIKAEMDMSNRTRRLNREWDRITKDLSKEEFTDLTGLMFLGDAEAHTFSEGELKNFVTTDKVRAAYRKSRVFLDKLGRFTEQHRKAMALNVLQQRTKLLRRMAAARGMDPAEFRRLYDARADLLEKQRQGKRNPEKFEAELAEATVRLHGTAPVNEEYESWAEEADRLETQIRDIKIRRREGYVPHKFFGQWRIYREALDEDGDRILDDYGEPTWDPVAGDHGFFPTRREAVLAANQIAKDEPNAKLKVSPEEFDFPRDEATMLGDAAFFRFLGKVGEQFEVEGEALHDLVRGVARRRFRRRIADFEQYRRNIEGYSKDLDRVMRTHIGQTVRYVSLDRLKYDAINTIEREGLSPYRSSVQDRPELAAAVNQWFKDVNGEKQRVESYVDNLLGKEWVSPLYGGLAAGGLAFAATGGLVGPGAVTGLVAAYVGYRVGRGMAQGGEFKTRAITGAMLGDMSHLKLGMFFNLMSAVVNTTQVALNTAPVLGPRDTAIGIKRFERAVRSKIRGKPNADWRLLERNDIHPLDTMAEGTRHQFQGESRLSKISMIFFTGAESFNRGSTLLGAINKAQREGKTPGEAQRFGRDAMTRTQFHYGAANKPELLRNVFLRVPTQFKNFVAQQLTFLLGLSKKELPLFLLSMTLTAGALGIPGLDALDALMDWLFKISPIAEMKLAALKAAAKGELEEGIATFLTRGVPGLAGIDMAGRVGMGDKFLPLQVRDWKGAWWSTLENAVRHGQEGATVADQLRNVSPGVGNPLKVLENWMNGGMVTNPWKRNRPEYRMTEREMMLKAFGARPIREARLQDLRDVERRDTEHRRLDARRYVDRIVRAQEEGDTAEVDRIYAEAEAEGVPISAASVRSALRAMGQTRAERELRNLPRDLRGRGMELRDAIGAQ